MWPGLLCRPERTIITRQPQHSDNLAAAAQLEPRMEDRLEMRQKLV